MYLASQIPPPCQQRTWGFLTNGLHSSGSVTTSNPSEGTHPRLLSSDTLLVVLPSRSIPTLGFKTQL